ncbi:hypothetical protein OG698_45445 [Streptomyces sp. NBC_01003]|uniref:hypothetical protein n=1 Tax=Streptomyces sp. NBC_01003 TaxID=2903714 RepID=UPI003865CB4D|nr:hypothetical protein OG698_45445 [Streptomyces sp. NBC_01003]
MVQGPGQLPVRGPGRLQLLCPLVERALRGSDLLLEKSDAASELVNVDGGAKARFGLDGIAKLGEQAVLQLPDPCGEALVALQRVREIGMQRSPADRGDPPIVNRRVGDGVDAFE